MADTTKANVLIIAPELSDAITNVAKVVRISVATLSNLSVYSVTINGTTYAYTSDTTATAIEICAGLVSAITSTAVTKIDNLDGTFDLTGATAGTDYTLSVSSKLSADVITDNFNGDALFNLILADVIEEIDTLSIDSATQEKAQRYLTAHLIACQTFGGATGNVKSESVGRASVTYSGGDMLDPDMLSKTRYGAEFWRIWKKHRVLRGL